MIPRRYVVLFFGGFLKVFLNKRKQQLSHQRHSDISILWRLWSNYESTNLSLLNFTHYICFFWRKNDFIFLSLCYKAHFNCSNPFFWVHQTQKVDFWAIEQGWRDAAFTHSFYIVLHCPSINFWELRKLGCWKKFLLIFGWSSFQLFNISVNISMNIGAIICYSSR